jgi:DNA-binding YbaB/EbfC family protein
LSKSANDLFEQWSSRFFDPACGLNITKNTSAGPREWTTWPRRCRVSSPSKLSPPAGAGTGQKVVLLPVPHSGLPACPRLLFPEKNWRAAQFGLILFRYFMSSIGKLMKQAARMQQQMEQVQTSLAARTVEATSGGGAVKVVAKCDGSIASVKIDPQALNPSDAQLLEDMIVTAANQALGQAKEISTAEMGKVTAGLNLPGSG